MTTKPSRSGSSNRKSQIQMNSNEHILENTLTALSASISGMLQGMKNSKKRGKDRVPDEPKFEKGWDKLMTTRSKSERKLAEPMIELTHSEAIVPNIFSKLQRDRNRSVKKKRRSSTRGYAEESIHHDHLRHRSQRQIVSQFSDLPADLSVPQIPLPMRRKPSKSRKPEAISPIRTYINGGRLRSGYEGDGGINVSQSEHHAPRKGSLYLSKVFQGTQSPGGDDRVVELFSSHKSREKSDDHIPWKERLELSKEKYKRGKENRQNDRTLLPDKIMVSDLGLVKTKKNQRDGVIKRPKTEGHRNDRIDEEQHFLKDTIPISKTTMVLSPEGGDAGVLTSYNLLPKKPRTSITYDDDGYAYVVHGYEEPTISSKNKKYERPQKQSVQVVSPLPFVTAASTAPTFNIMLSIQQVLSAMKLKSKPANMTPMYTERISNFRQLNEICMTGTKSLLKLKTMLKEL